MIKMSTTNGVGPRRLDMAEWLYIKSKKEKVFALESVQPAKSSGECSK